MSLLIGEENQKSSDYEAWSSSVGRRGSRCRLEFPLAARTVQGTPDRQRWRETSSLALRAGKEYGLQPQTLGLRKEVTWWALHLERWPWNINHLRDASRRIRKEKERQQESPGPSDQMWGRSVCPLDAGVIGQIRAEASGRFHLGTCCIFHDWGGCLILELRIEVWARNMALEGHSTQRTKKHNSPRKRMWSEKRWWT